MENETSKTTAKKPSVWQKIVKEELKQGEPLKKALANAKERYAVYKKTGKIPPVI